MATARPVHLWPQTRFPPDSDGAEDFLGERNPRRWVLFGQWRSLVHLSAKKARLRAKKDTYR
jgi:hypothetical protein